MIDMIPEQNSDIKKYEYNKDLARELLQKNGWDKTGEDGILMNNDDRLTLKLTTSTWSELINIA